MYYFFKSNGQELLEKLNFDIKSDRLASCKLNKPKDYKKTRVGRSSGCQEVL